MALSIFVRKTRPMMQQVKFPAIFFTHHRLSLMVWSLGDLIGREGSDFHSLF
jgi:hypothetical protein